MLSRLVKTFLPRSKRLIISWLQSPSAVILEPSRVKSLTVSASICHEVMGPNVMILVFWMLSFKPTFSLFTHLYFVTITWPHKGGQCFLLCFNFLWLYLSLTKNFAIHSALNWIRYFRGLIQTELRKTLNFVFDIVLLWNKWIDMIFSDERLVYMRCLIYTSEYCWSSFRVRKLFFIPCTNTYASKNI